VWFLVFAPFIEGFCGLFYLFGFVPKIKTRPGVLAVVSQRARHRIGWRACQWAAEQVCQHDDKGNDIKTSILACDFHVISPFGLDFAIALRYAPSWERFAKAELLEWSHYMLLSVDCVVIN
jgi:hypothetical protein